MGVDYSKQYKPAQLEPFFPNEMIKMFTSMIVTLAVIVILVLLLPEAEETPADPRNTPPHIKPEWYFLAVYQTLKLMPQSLLGISGKVLGIFSQGLAFVGLLTLPFWYRNTKGFGGIFKLAVTAGIFAFLGLTIYGLWPEDSEGRLLSIAVFLDEHWLFATAIGASLVFFYFAMAWEERDIRRNWRA